MEKAELLKLLVEHNKTGKGYQIQLNSGNLDDKSARNTGLEIGDLYFTECSTLKDSMILCFGNMNKKPTGQAKDGTNLYPVEINSNIFIDINKIEAVEDVADFADWFYLPSSKVVNVYMYPEIKNPVATKKGSIMPEQKIIEFDNRMNEIDREISSLRTERESLMRRRSSLFESLDIPCELKYEFFVEDDNFMGLGYLYRNCRFYIEVSGKKQILLECGVYSDESPSSTWLRHIPEKYKNDFIMLWKKAHKEDVEWNREQMRKFDENFEKSLINDTNKCKDFYKQCYKTLAKSVHPDEGGNVEAMQCLNQLKVMWGI